MIENFDYDVFLSHSAKDKTAVREVAERLKKDGLRVWFDEWTIKPGDIIGIKIEEGLQRSRTLILFMSINAFSSEWVALERHTTLFRAPTNKNRRFIPLKLDNAEAPDLLKQFSYIDWRQRSEEQYEKLFQICQYPEDDEKDVTNNIGANSRYLRDDLEFLQSLSQEEFSEWVLIPLLEEMGYSNIRYTRGRLEAGKDVIFSHENPLEGYTHLCATVKRSPLIETAPGSSEISDIALQISQILANSFIDLRTGSSITVSKVFWVTPFQILPSAASIIKDKIQQYADRIVFIDGHQLLSLIEKYLPSLLMSLPNPESRYLYLLCQRFIDNPTLSRLGSTRPLTILDIYTGGYIGRINKEEAKYISFALPESSAANPRAVTTLRRAFDNNPFCVVLADVGSGKTTLLQKLVLDFGHVTKGRQHITGGLTPIFFSLSNLPVVSLKTFDTFCSFLTDYIQNTDKLDSFNLDSAGKYYLLLDGFDELRGEHDQVQQYVTKLAKYFAKVAVTSRPSRTPELPEPFVYYRLLPFDDSNIKEFLEKWFDQDKVLQNNVFERISANSNLKQFCRTPLILTLYSILASTSESFEQLPIRRTAIYEQIIQMLLGKWDRLRNVKNQYDADLKQYLLEIIAYETHSRRSRTFYMYQFVRLASELMQSSGLTDDPEELINEIVFRSSLIRRTSQHDEYEFVHLSFQEYLAARRLSRNVENRSMVNDVEDEWWKGCFIFYFGICRTLDGLIIPRKLKRHRGVGLRFIEFLAEADFTSPGRRSQILSFLGKDLLGSGKLSNSDLQICSRLGDNLVQILGELVQSDSFTGNFSNYFTILRSINTKQANKTIWEGSAHLANLPILSLSEEVAKNLGSAIDEKGTKFIVDGLKALAKKLKSYGCESPDELTSLCSYIRETASSLPIWLARGLVEQKLVAKVLENWEQVCGAVAVCLSHTGALNGLSNSNRKEILQTVLATWSGPASIRAFLAYLQNVPVPSQNWWRGLGQSPEVNFIKDAWAGGNWDSAREILNRKSYLWSSQEVASFRHIFEQILQVETIWSR